MLKTDKLLTGLNFQFTWLMNTLDWLRERLNWKSKSKNKRILLKMLNHGSNSTPLNWKTVKRDLLDKTHGMQSNHKSMRNKLLTGIFNLINKKSCLN